MREERAFGMAPEIGRWGFILVGLTMNLCLGAVYAYSIFKPAVEKVHGVNAFQGNLPFMTFLLCFAITMFFGGRLMERIGPRWLAMIGGLIVGLGWMLSSMATSIWMLVLTYGVIAGSGVGLVYGCPVAMGARWFPDRKGLAVGLMLAGFGGSAVITGRIAGLLIGDIKALPVEELAVTLPRTFLSFGVVFAALLVLLSLPFRFPAAGWKPWGWSPTAASAATIDLDGWNMLKTSTFWGLFLCYTIGCLAGLMAIGISKPVGSEVIKIASGGVLLLRRRLAVVFEDLPDHRQEGFQLGLRPMLRLPISRRLVVGQHLLERVPANPVLRDRRPLTQGAGQHLTPYLAPNLHVAVHSCASL
jgi:OFA family oxalate/formate antiporter-like MFS transporter